jgi:hypothetical protein
MADIKMQGGDMVIEDGEISFVTHQPAIGQHIEMRLRTFLGETVYDQSAGVPYIQVIFLKQTPLDSVQFILEQNVLSTPGVTGIEEFDLTLDSLTRGLSVVGSVTTIDGDVDFDVSLTQTQG